MKLSVFIATSLDGFIARENGDIDWLETDETTESQEDYGYNDFMDSIDALVMGRKSYQQVLAFNQWPYGDKRVIVLTKQTLDIPADLADSVELQSCTPQKLVELLSAQNVKHLYIDGGKTIQGYLNAGLINELTITRIPVLLGSGIPLFSAVEHDIRLIHLSTQAYPSGLVQSRYKVVQE